MAHPDAGSSVLPEPLVSILHFELPADAVATRFVEEYRPVVERHVSGWPGFIGATLHLSTDDTRVIATVRWRDEVSYQHFLDESDAEARMAAITAAFDAVPGMRGPQMDRVHTYGVAAEILPSS